MHVVWWFAAIVVMAIGLLGTIVPMLPGTTIILGAAISHRFLAGAEYGMSWWALAILVLLTLVSYGIDLASRYLGTRYFGATRWGMAGVVVGVIVGVFTGFVTLLVAPIIGAIIGELIAGQRVSAAGKAGWGALLGNLAGMAAQLALGLTMIILFVMNASSPGR